LGLQFFHVLSFKSNDLGYRFENLTWVDIFFFFCLFSFLISSFNLIYVRLSQSYDLTHLFYRLIRVSSLSRLNVYHAISGWLKPSFLSFFIQFHSSKGFFPTYRDRFFLFCFFTIIFFYHLIKIKPIYYTLSGL
jgi:hypothetical protein